MASVGHVAARTSWNWQGGDSMVGVDHIQAADVCIRPEFKWKESLSDLEVNSTLKSKQYNLEIYEAPTNKPVKKNQ